ncbi:MAG: UbiA family prenyltransferase [Nocardioidaceae bacterium]
MAGRTRGYGCSADRPEKRTPTVPDRPPTTSRRPTALLRAAHIGPALAVTVIVGLLAMAADLPLSRTVLVVAAVLTGQLSIGWSNDLVDLPRDRQVGRSDKPLARGEIGVGAVRTACAVAVVATIVLSFACGLVAGCVQLVTVVAGWAYNLGLKSTAWSWLPYAVAFGALPIFVTLSQDPPAVPPPWVPLAGALLGVGAHLVNALPDFADDAATGVRGLPHRIGARWTPMAATAVLVLASVVICVASGGDHPLLVAVSLVLVAGLAVIGLLGSGRTPFRAAMAIALVDVALLAGVR